MGGCVGGRVSVGAESGVSFFHKDPNAALKVVVWWRRIWRTNYLGFEEIWGRCRSKEGGERRASFGAIKHLSGISSSLWKMFKSLKKKPEKAKEAIDFKLKFHATRVRYVYVCQSVFLWASLLWCVPGCFWFRLCALECSYGICLSVRAVSLVCLH